MNKLKILFLIGACFLQCKGREPFKPAHGSLPFLAYFPSRYRGLCVGTLVSRVAVLTAAVCVTNPMANIKDTRAINVVLGATYRHPRRGIRVQVTKILIPNRYSLHLTYNNELDKHAYQARFCMDIHECHSDRQRTDQEVSSGAVGMAECNLGNSAKVNEMAEGNGFIIRPIVSKIGTGNRGYLMSKSAALLLLKRKIPDVLTEIPLRPIDIDYKGEEVLSLQEECLMPGWHFFYKGEKITRTLANTSSEILTNNFPIPTECTCFSLTFAAHMCLSFYCRHKEKGGIFVDFIIMCPRDKIYPVNKFLLQRNVRVQFLNIVKKNLWCDALTIKFQTALNNLGFLGMFDKSACICVRDPDRTAQPCHGMYGAPLICRGRAVGMMMAPDAQWSNCTGFSNVIHVFSSTYLKEYMACISTLFEADEKVDWVTMKKKLYEDFKEDAYDYMPAIYDRITSSSASTSDLRVL